MARVKRGVTAHARHKKVLELAGLELDRKVLSDIAIREPEAFTAVIAAVQAALEQPQSAAA